MCGVDENVGHQAHGLATLGLHTTSSPVPMPEALCAVRRLHGLVPVQANPLYGYLLILNCTPHHGRHSSDFGLIFADHQDAFCLDSYLLQAALWATAGQA